LATPGKKRSNKCDTPDETETRRLQVLYRTLTEIQANPRLVRRETLARAPFYVSHDLTQPRRELNRDIEYWTQDRESPLICSFSKNDPIAALPILPCDTRFRNDLYCHLLEKQAIAKYVAEQLLHYYHLVFLDSGTTVFHIAFELAKSDIGHNLSVITNNLYILPLLVGKVPLKIIGGTVRKDTAYIASSPAYNIAAEETNNTKIQQSFISVTSIYNGGFYCEEALVNDKRRAVSVAQEAITFVADHSKIRIASGSGRQFISINGLKELRNDEGNPLKISIITDKYDGYCSRNDCSEVKSKEVIFNELKKFRDEGIYVNSIPIKV
jgi:DeoR/GlpR family transcriptional regulator of sugar metabolism